MALAVGASLACSAGKLTAQELIYQEGFNSDGEAAGRYTTTGHDVYEQTRILGELGNADQKGPIYWARNTEVSFVGVPNIPARRMIFTLRMGTDLSAFTPELLKLLDSSIAWLLEGKTSVTIAVSPNILAIGAFGDHLAALGHTLIDDDPTILNDPDIKADLYIHGIGGNSSRYVMVPKPVICLSAAEYDDLLLAGIGQANISFAPGQVNIAAAGHPAAGGQTASFTGFTGTGNQAFDLVYRYLPSDATVLATVNRTIAPTVVRLPDVDDIISGIRQSTNATAKVTEIDFSDGNVGLWPYDNPIPGGFTGVWGLQVKGKLSVAAPGTYRLAVASADGASLRIDRDKNGLTADDLVIEDFGPHNTHTADYNDVEFTAAGTYDFEIRSFNNGGAGSLEFAAAIQAGEVPDDALDSGFWELLGTAGAVSPITLAGTADATAYIATGANSIERQPLIVLFNGPNDNPPGNFNGGGPFIGFEGTGFYAGSGMNKWPYPATGSYRSVTLKPVNVTGKKDVRLTVAFAAAQIDFEDSDFLDVYIYPTGATSTPIQLAHFRAVENGVQPWLADQKQRYIRPLTREFADFTYKIPTNATDLIVEFRVASSWWNEILALDNVRITSGLPVAPPPIGNLTGLLGYWRMDETSGDAVPDSSGYNHNGSIINGSAGAWVTDAERGKVYRATGTNVIAFGAILPAMTTNNDFTWSLWIKSDETGSASATDNNIVFGNRYKSVSGTTGTDFSPREFIKFTPSKFEWHANAGAVVQDFDYTDFVTNTWTHHLVVKKGNTLTYYRDGVAASTNRVITSAPANPQPLFLGGQGTLERWRGAADEVAIFDRALSAAEAQQVFTLGKAGAALASPIGISGVTSTATSLTINWKGGTAPYVVQRKTSLTDANWVTVAIATTPTATVAKAGAAGFFRVSSGGSSTATAFKALLSGAAEVPTAVITSGSGFGNFVLDGTTLTYSIAFAGLSGNATGAHIHGPGSATQAVGVMIPLTVAAASSGFITGTATLTSAQVTSLTTGLTYANIHTALNGGGEIRGQILP